MMNIKGKSVLITGSNRGIGKALVKEACERGGRTCLRRHAYYSGGE
jgi:NAD(P)-dependent dehydrogenase (short-subunit alcohol dehydrogenase family)